LVPRGRPVDALALAPLRVVEAGPESLASALSGLQDVPAAAFLALLRRHQVDQLWLAAVTDAGLSDVLPEALAADLRAARDRAVARQLIQTAAVDLVTQTFESMGLEHVIIKGLHLAHALYDDPILRPAGDIDVVVTRDRRDDAIRALHAAGFKGAPDVVSIDREIHLDSHGTRVDLHWRLLRAGRSRIDLAPLLVARRHRLAGGAWVCDDTTTLLTLLVHPALTDQVTERWVRAVDLDRWIRTRPTPWEETIDLLREAGLRTAAWVMLAWTMDLLGTPVPDGAQRALAPGPIRRSYLRAWLRADPSAVHRRLPIAARLGFSLWLQDRPSDMVRAIRALRAATQAGATEADRIAGLMVGLD
jgi:hypothetical protein